MERKISVGLILLAMVLNCSTLGGRIISEELIFERATVYLEVDNDYVHVQGRFFIKNYSDQSSFLISFPFHIDEYMSPPFSIEIAADDTKIIYKEVRPDIIVFKVDVKKFERKSILISYSQQLYKKGEELKVTYVTTSIKVWGRPLINETFMIKIPGKYTIKEVSFPIKEEKSQDKFTILHIDMDNFYPDYDLVINLEKNSKRGENNE